MGRSCPNQVWAITFDWSALATWNKHFWTAFWQRQLRPMYSPLWNRWFPDLNEGAIFEQNSFSNICLSIKMQHKTARFFWKFQKKVFVNRSSVYVYHCQKALPFGTRERERGYSESWTFENVLSNYSSVQLVKLEEQHCCNWSSSWFSFGGFWFGWFCGFVGLLFSF